MRIVLMILLGLAALSGSWAQEPVAPPAADPAPAPVTSATPTVPTDPTPPKDPPLPEDDGSRVTILGYHEFSATKPSSAMRIRTEQFRKQIKALKTLNLPVISLEQFEKWKRGEESIPPRAVLITIDDGWKSVYTDAFPILKEHGYPFTLFLYTKYVDGGGRALTTKMIKDMQKHGCTLGGHSVSHPFPGTIKGHARRGEKDYLKFLRTEYGASKKFLEKQFSRPVHGYAYPGGYFTEDMFPIGDETGYEFFYTVKPGKIRRNSPNRTLARYIILGNYDQSFETATSFHATGGAAPVLGYQTTPHPVFPAPGSMVETRLPEIIADLSAVENLDLGSPVMRISGFGRVPATFDPAAKKISWTVNRRLRKRACEVSVQWRLLDKTKSETPMRWTFLIDLEASYQAGAE